MTAQPAFAVAADGIPHDFVSHSGLTVRSVMSNRYGDGVGDDVAGETLVADPVGRCRLGTRCGYAGGEGAWLAVPSTASSRADIEVIADS
jgi:hypothetical protein